MSETTNLKLFKHDNPATNQNEFDVQKALNDNWDKIDKNAGDNKNAIEQVQTNLDTKSIELQNNIDNQNKEMQELNKKLEDKITYLRDNQLTKEVEGSSIYITDADAQEAKIDITSGKSEQETSEQGKNLCDLTKAKLQSSSNNDKIINNANSITITPKNEQIHNYAKYFLDLDITQYLGKKLYLKVDKSRDNSSVSLTTFKDDGTAVNKSVSDILDIPVETDAAQIGIQFFAASGESANNLPVTFSNIMISLEDIEYEPFIPDSPSHEYPSEIRNCENINFLVTRNNLLKPTWAQDLLDRLNIQKTDQNNCITEIDGYRYFKYRADLGYKTELKYFVKDCFKENTQYTFKCILMRDNNSLDANISIKYTDETYTEIRLPEFANMKRIEIKTTSAKNKTIQDINIAYSSGHTYIDLDSVMLYEGTEDLPYEGYGKTYSFPLKERTSIT